MRLLNNWLVIRKAQLLARRGELMVFMWTAGKEIQLELNARFTSAKAMQLYNNLFQAYECVQLLVSSDVANIAAANLQADTQDKEDSAESNTQRKTSPETNKTEDKTILNQILILRREHALRLYLVQAALSQRTPLAQGLASNIDRSATQKPIKSVISSRIRSAASQPDSAQASRELIAAFLTLANSWHGEQLYKSLERCEEVTRELFGPHNLEAI